MSKILIMTDSASDISEAEEKELETGEPVELVDTDYEDFYNNIEAQKALDRIGEEEE